MRERGGQGGKGAEEKEREWAETDRKPGRRNNGKGRTGRNREKGIA